MAETLKEALENIQYLEGPALEREILWLLSRGRQGIKGLAALLAGDNVRREWLGALRVQAVRAARLIAAEQRLRLDEPWLEPVWVVLGGDAVAGEAADCAGRGDLDRAAALAGVAVRLGQRAAGAMILGEVALHQGRSEEAVGHYRAALAGETRGARQGLGQALLAAGQWSAGWETLWEAVAAEGPDRALLGVIATAYLDAAAAGVALLVPETAQVEAIAQFGVLAMELDARREISEYQRALQELDGVCRRIEECCLRFERDEPGRERWGAELRELVDSGLRIVAGMSEPGGNGKELDPVGALLEKRDAEGLAVLVAGWPSLDRPRMLEGALVEARARARVKRERNLAAVAGRLRVGLNQVEAWARELGQDRFAGGVIGERVRVWVGRMLAEAGAARFQGRPLTLTGYHDVAGTVDVILRDSAAAIYERGLSVSRRYDEGIPRVQADRAWLEWGLAGSILSTDRGQELQCVVEYDTVAGRVTVQLATPGEGVFFVAEFAAISERRLLVGAETRQALRAADALAQAGGEGAAGAVHLYAKAVEFELAGKLVPLIRRHRLLPYALAIGGPGAPDRLRAAVEREAARVLPGWEPARRQAKLDALLRAIIRDRLGGELADWWVLAVALALFGRHVSLEGVTIGQPILLEGLAEEDVLRLSGLLGQLAEARAVLSRGNTPRDVEDVRQAALGALEILQRLPGDGHRKKEG